MSNEVNRTVSSFRDLQCASDVGRMVELGKFAVEFNGYGCTYMECGKQYYRAGSKPEALYGFVRECSRKGIYPTPIEQYTYRTVVPAEMHEYFAEQTKIKLIQQMKETYRGLYAVLQPLADTPPNGVSLPLLLQEAEQLEGHFDDMALQRFAGTIELAYNAKILDEKGWMQLEQWMRRERKQMEDEPVVQEQVERTFYGFGYLSKNGLVEYFCNAQPAAVLEQHQKLELDGIFVCPVLKKQYWFAGTNQIKIIRQQFMDELERWHDQDYIHHLQQLKRLPGVISKERLQLARKQLEPEVSSQAMNVFDYYSRRWNLCE